MKSLALVTGVCGLVGSTVARQLVHQGYTVVGYDRRQPVHAVDGVRYRQRDVGQAGGLYDDDLRRARFLFHCAAHVGVMETVLRPAQLMANNITATMAVLAAVERHPHLHAFLCSSSEVYGNVDGDLREDGPIGVGNPANARWAYASAKLVEEHLAAAARREGLHVITGRLFNVVGDAQRTTAGFVLPSFAAAVRRGENLQLHGDGSQTRCFCHVEDTVRAMLALMDLERPVHGVYNIGSTTAITMQALAELVITMSGADVGITAVALHDLPHGFDEVRHRRPNVERLQVETAWSPRLTIEDIVADYLGITSARTMRYAVR